MSQFSYLVSVLVLACLLTTPQNASSQAGPQAPEPSSEAKQDGDARQQEARDRQMLEKTKRAQQAAKEKREKEAMQERSRQAQQKAEPDNIEREKREAQKAARPKSSPQIEPLLPWPRKP